MTSALPLSLPLRSLQVWLLQVISHPESAAAGVAANAGRVAPADVDRVVRRGRTETALSRLETYQRSYFARLGECLADDYPALKHAIGDAEFADLCRAYIVAHPSREPSLNGFGRYLPRFASSLRPSLGRFAADLARLEWALVDAVHAESVAFPAETMSQFDEAALPDLCFIANRATRVLWFEYPVSSFLQAVLDGNDAELPSWAPTAVAVARSGYHVWRLDLAAVEAQLLRRVLSGEPLGRALDGIEADGDELRAWFQKWTLRGMFADVRLDAAGAGRLPDDDGKRRARV